METIRYMNIRESGGYWRSRLDRVDQSILKWFGDLEKMKDGRHSKRTRKVDGTEGRSRPTR